MRLTGLSDDEATSGDGSLLLLCLSVFTSSMSTVMTTGSKRRATTEVKLAGKRHLPAAVPVKRIKYGSVSKISGSFLLKADLPDYCDLESALRNMAECDTNAIRAALANMDPTHKDWKAKSGLPATYKSPSVVKSLALLAAGNEQLAALVRRACVDQLHALFQTYDVGHWKRTGEFRPGLCNENHQAATTANTEGEDNPANNHGITGQKLEEDLEITEHKLRDETGHVIEDEAGRAVKNEAGHAENKEAYDEGHSENEEADDEGHPENEEADDDTEYVASGVIGTTKDEREDNNTESTNDSGKTTKAEVAAERREAFHREFLKHLQEIRTMSFRGEHPGPARTSGSMRTRPFFYLASQKELDLEALAVAIRRYPCKSLVDYDFFVRTGRVMAKGDVKVPDEENGLRNRALACQLLWLYSETRKQTGKVVSATLTRDVTEWRTATRFNRLSPRLIDAWDALYALRDRVDGDENPQGTANADELSVVRMCKLFQSIDVKYWIECGRCKELKERGEEYPDVDVGVPAYIMGKKRLELYNDCRDNRRDLLQYIEDSPYRPTSDSSETIPPSDEVIREYQLYWLLEKTKKDANSVSAKAIINASKQFPKRALKKSARFSIAGVPPDVLEQVRHVLDPHNLTTKWNRLAFLPPPNPEKARGFVPE